jgi:hypothetical protein
VAIGAGGSPKNNSVVSNEQGDAGLWLKVASGELLLDKVHPFGRLHLTRRRAKGADDD